MTEFKHQGAEKKKYVKDMFDDISEKYDFLNHLLSFGIDYYWRFRLVRFIQPQAAQRILDVATGTGDVGFAILKRNNNLNIIGLDYAYNMVKIGLQKAKKRKIHNFKFVQGDGEHLPFKDNQFDTLTIAYGFRNIGHYDLALNEFFRVLKPNGKLAILEFSTPQSKIFDILYQWYFKNVLPRIAGLFSRSDAYRYLPESVENFPERPEMLEMIRSAGFCKPGCIDLTFGVTSIFHGIKTEL